MNGREIYGVFITAFGAILIIISLYTSLFILIYGIPIFIIGLLISINKKEDKIEEVNYMEDKNKKWPKK